MPYELPLTPSVPFYSFDTTLAGTTYSIAIAWSDVDSAWYMDLAQQDGTPIATAIKLVLGVTIGPRLVNRVSGAPNGFFYVIDTSGQGQDAGFDDMGTRVVVKFYYDNEMLLRLALGLPVPSP